MAKEMINHKTIGHPVDVVQFGTHLMLDGYDGTAARLADRSLIAAILNTLPDELGMHKIADPVVVSAGTQNSRDASGLSGFVLIAESHISLHTFPLRGFVSADVYTCQNSLDLDKITSCFKRSFELKLVERHKINRGLSFPIRNVHTDTAPASRGADHRMRTAHGC